MSTVPRVVSSLTSCLAATATSALTSAFTSASALTIALVACSASPDGTDGGSKADARDRTPIADARPPIVFIDAMPRADAVMACPDNNEPNNTGDMATALPEESDLDGDSSLSGAVISGDEDWFTYVGNDGVGSVDPTIEIVSGDVRVCIMFTCEGNSELTLNCPSMDNMGQPGVLSSAGPPKGCCHTSGFTIDDIGCAGTLFEDGTVHMQIRSNTQDVCESYEINYHF